MDQQYNYSPRDFVTVSARADTIEFLAGQESEILNVGPEPERATVTTGAQRGAESSQCATWSGTYRNFWHDRTEQHGPYSSTIHRRQ